MRDSRRSIWAWAMYDWAASAFSTTVIAGFFPVFFKSYWADPSHPGESTFWLGIANSGASLLVALLAPLLGAVADRGASKKRFLFLFAFLGIGMSAGLFFVARGEWILAAVLFVCASAGYAGGNIFYDSLLPAVASPRRVDFVSILGYAFGYIGGGILFLVNVIMYLKPGLFGLADGAAAVRVSFLSVGLWWALFSLPLVLLIREPRFHETIRLGDSFRAGFRQVAGTLREMKNLRVIGLFMLAYVLYIDGVGTVVRMAVDYGMSLGFPPESLIVALLIVQFVAFPSALAYNALAQRIGVKAMVLVGIAGYCAITVFGYFMTKSWHFYLIAVSVALFQGGIQALSRSLYTRLIPESKAAEFFGFYNMFGKFSVVIGPVLMGSITLLTGNVRASILSLLVLFLAGGYLLVRVDFKEGERIAREHLS